MEILFYTVISFIIISFVVIKEKITYGRTVTPRVVFLLCYFYFCYGPVMAFAMGYPIYSGINVNYISESAFVFVLAIAGFSLAPSNIEFAFFRSYLIKTRELQSLKLYSLWAMLLSSSALILIAFSLYGLAEVGKVDKISGVGIFHYVLMTFWPVFLFVYFASADFFKVDRREKLLLLISILIYVAYCIYMDERDFVMLGFPIMFWVYKNNIIPIQKILVIFVLASVYMVLGSVGRSAQFDEGAVISLLNQGSNLLVLSNVISWVDQGLSFDFGLSIISSLTSTLTLGIVNIQESRATWFSREFSPNSADGAYGFSLESEILLSYGQFAVLFFFYGLSVFITWAYRLHLKNNNLGSLFTYYNLFFLVYAIRGETLMVFKSLFYCYFVFFVFKSFSVLSKRN